MTKLLFTLSVLAGIIGLEKCLADTLNISTASIDNLKGYVYHYEIKRKDSIIDKDFIKNYNNYNFKLIRESNVNFGFSNSVNWLRIELSNKLLEDKEFVLEVRNPDLDYISFYLLKKDSVIKEIHTGEIQDVSSRDIIGRNFLFKMSLKADSLYTVLIRVDNEGHVSTAPLYIKEIETFRDHDAKIALIFWMLFGLLMFILIFNSYLYLTTLDKVNLYYSIYVFFAILVAFVKDGYLYIFNLPAYVEEFKYFYPSLYIVFIFQFTQAFFSLNKKQGWLNTSFRILKITALALPLFYFFNYPVTLIVDIGIPTLLLLSIVIIITLGASYFKARYSPSVLFLLAYCIMFAAIFIHQLKEVNAISSTLFYESSFFIGLSIECTLLTLAVLERFRIKQRNAQKIIQDNYHKIEYQNKELEYINTELEKLSLVASETGNSIAIFDISGNLEWCNTGFEQYYDITQIELIEERKDHIRDIIPDDKIDKYVKLCLTNKEHSIFETLIKTVRKKEMWLQITLSPFIQRGRVKKLIAIGSDISELKKYEKKLTKALEKAEESDKLKTAFLANVSHEVRTPLNGIIGFTDLLALNNLSDAKRQKYIQTIQTNGQQLLHIIEDLVEISLIEARQLKISSVVFSLTSILQESVDFFNTYKNTIEKGHFTITSSFEHDLKYDLLYTDPFRITQVLNSLFNNAFKFSEDGNIHLTSELVDRFIQVSIEDEGKGVEEKSKNEIFELFRQEELSLSRQYGGTGLGLSISKGIIDILGGEIWLDTTYTKGARFCFKLPLTLVSQEVKSA